MKRRVNRFTVLELAEYRGTTPYYKVQCDCGAVSIKSGANIKTQKGCGGTCPFTLVARQNQAEQARQRAQKINFKGKKMTRSEIALKLGVTNETVIKRIATKTLSKPRYYNHRLYRGQPMSYWLGILGIAKSTFKSRVSKYGADSDRVYEKKRG